MLPLSILLSLAAPMPVDFQRDIRPLLADHCFACHGPDDAARKGKLRLDLRADALKGGRSGDPAIVPGKSDMGTMLQRLTSDEPAKVMPPPATKKKLSATQIDLVRRWIAQGAEYQAHWAFAPPKKPVVPAMEKSPIDAFLLARLMREKLTFAPEASRETLLRRLSLDLIGLPPTLAELDAFVNDAAPEAYEKQVERLLRSPRYGEKWGRFWLDGARYADSDGFEKDKPRSVWMYRDWVVAAFNRDLPYDRFVTEQLAGDLLPNATQDQKVATGFLRNSMINEEGGIDPEQFRMEAMFDRMDALGKSVLGLTIQCAQCHNHKYDPITQEDYYRLFAYLNDTHETQLAVYSPDEQRRRGDLFAKIREIEESLRHRAPEWQTKMTAWEAKVRDVPAWSVVRIANAGDNSQRYITRDDGSVTAWGYAPTKWSSTFTGSSPLKKVTGFRLEVMTDPNLPLGGPGRSPLGLLALSEFAVDVSDPKNPSAKTRVKLVEATADYGNDDRPLEAMFDDRGMKKRTTGPVAFAIDGKDETAWGIDAGPGRRNVDRKAVFVPEKPLDLPEGATLTFTFKQMHGGWNSDDNQNNNLGRFRVSVTDVPAPKADPLPGSVRVLLAIPSDKRTEAQTRAVFSTWRENVAEWKDANAEIETLWKSHPVGASQLTLASREMSRATHVLGRGDFLKPGKAVEAGVPGFLNPMPKDAPANRLGLARWLTDANAPTVSRAIVNRVWQAYFGTGLVATSEDLGTQSESPSHPELLDWLAVDFREGGWSFKALHRKIVTSRAYRQTSKVSPEMQARDPDNRLLARGPRFRVEGETVRDIALFASGLLSEATGGPPVYPPAPAFLFLPPTSYGPKVWTESTGEDRYRRALYTFRFRSVPYPVYANFDVPNGDASCVRRVRSNTPLQALTTLNETLFLEAARSLAITVLAEAEPKRIVHAFRRCTGRTPSADEVRVLSGFLGRQLEKFAAPDAKPWDLAANDPANPPKLPPGATPAQVAAWTALARVLLNLDETISKE